MAGCCGGSKNSKCGTGAEKKKDKAPAQCAAKTVAGTRCKRLASSGSKFCSSHSK